MTHPSLSLDDAQARQTALTPNVSYIVQAPAGSGKTSLLIARLLVLLANVHEPEEVLAITFTRKAASEMRSRLLEALESATGPCPDAAHDKAIWQLANTLLQHDHNKQWNLLNNPNRLRIQTIDSFCASITRQLPLQSELGGLKQIHDTPSILYLEAATRLTRELDDDLHWTPALLTLLKHLDTNFGRVNALLANLLACREQWLPYLVQKDSASLKHELEQGLKAIAEEALQNFQQHWQSTVDSQQFHSLLQFAKENSDEHSALHAIAPEHLEQFSIESLPHWQRIATWLLTTDGSIRKSFTVKQGFPAPSKNKEKQSLFSAMKTLMSKFADSLRERPRIIASLQQIQILPPSQYEESQWRIIDALTTALPVLVAELQLLFSEQNCMDFTEINLRALFALGYADDPSDIALKLDHRLSHILVDEFQDTSSLQFRLLQKLTQGWETGDGRSLFVVGDPMQSIYRFRKAEVGLFLQAFDHGIGHIKLTPLRLRKNFRSQGGLVAWFNHTFETVFPNQQDFTLGAIPYAQAESTQQTKDTPAVESHCSSTPEEQIQQIISIIESTPTSHNIAILLRARSHAIELLPALANANISYQATEIESLADAPVIQDLLCLTRALLNPADRIAWLALLRAPWCGLKLSDLHAIAKLGGSQSLLDLLQKPDKLELSIDAKQRLPALTAVLQSCYAVRQSQSLFHAVYAAWQGLALSSLYPHPHEHEQAECFFDLLKNKHTLQIDSISEFEKNLAALWAVQSTPQARVEVMTIHKSKGLEFDTVILPALERREASDSEQFLLWSERTNKQSQHLIIAPIKSNLEQFDPTYRYLRFEEKQKSLLESQRLLYVAATRAQSCLHLCATLEAPEAEKEITPPSSGALAHLWPVCHADFQPSQHTNTPAANISENRPPDLTRLKKPIDYVPDLDFSASNPPITEITFAPNYASIEGTVLHQLLAEIAMVGVESWKNNQTALHESWLKARLREHGLPAERIEASIKRLITGLNNMLNDEKGRWMLSHHPEAYNEHALSLAENDTISHLVLDRVFVDGDTVWIIDYKTSEPSSDQTQSQFLTAQQKRYAAQLTLYADALVKTTSLPIKLGLYFPMISEFVSWNYQPELKNS